MIKVIAAILILIALGFGIYYFYPKTSHQATTTTPSPSPTITPEQSLLIDAATWYPSAPWSEPAASTEQTTYGNLSGQMIQATVTSPNASLSHFEMVSELKQQGFAVDNNLSADGPGSSNWGYKRQTNNQNQIMLFSYKTQSSDSNPNEPIQFSCPCKIDVTVFVSNPF